MLVPIKSQLANRFISPVFVSQNLDFLRRLHTFNGMLVNGGGW